MSDGALLVLTTPVALVFYFALAYSFAFAVTRGRDPAWLHRAGGLLYVVFLGGWTLCVAATGAERLRILGSAGLAWMVIGVLSAPFLFGIELLIARFSQHVVRQGRETAWRRRILEGGTQEISSRPITIFALEAVAVALLEELLFRGYGLGTLQAGLGVTATAATAITSLLFGVNHYYFGARNVLSKTIDGLAWGGLAQASHSLAPSLASHLVFQSCAGYWLWRRSRTARRETRVSSAVRRRWEPEE